MILTNKQEQGLKIAIERYNNRERYTCIAGYAGTGKSTLVNFIIDALKINPEFVAYVAFTGKASMVLKEKGCKNAMTAHRLLYKSFMQKDGTFKHIPLWPLEQRYDLIVVDEVSMLPLDMWNLLLSHRIPVIALGDPGQLPPVDENQNNHILDAPHIFLDEVMRQAQESEIIRLSMDIRNGKTIPYQKGSEVMVVSKSESHEGMLAWADQILVGKNKTRYDINQQMRKLIFQNENIDLTPRDGDKIICLKNDWDTTNIEGDCLVNGEIGTILTPKIQYAKYVGNVVKADFKIDYANSIPFYNLDMDLKMFKEHKETITPDKIKKIPKKMRPKVFDYGYAITVHKSQGSEWDKVLVCEEYLGGTEHNKWLYTAATRAKEKLILIK